MKKGQDTIGWQRYMALDIQRESILAGAWNEEKDWVLTPRQVIKLTSAPVTKTWLTKC